MKEKKRGASGISLNEEDKQKQCEPYGYSREDSGYGLILNETKISRGRVSCAHSLNKKSKKAIHSRET